MCHETLTYKCATLTCAIELDTQIIYENAHDLLTNYAAYNAKPENSDNTFPPTMTIDTTVNILLLIQHTATPMKVIRGLSGINRLNDMNIFLLIYQLLPVTSVESCDSALTSVLNIILNLIINLRILSHLVVKLSLNLNQLPCVIKQLTIKCVL